MQNLIVHEFRQQVQTLPEAQILDVRTPAEFAAGHIPGALCIDIYSADFVERCLAELDPSKPVLVYCRSGARSSSAADFLARSGYHGANLIGGFTAWDATDHA